MKIKKKNLKNFSIYTQLGYSQNLDKLPENVPHYFLKHHNVARIKGKKILNIYKNSKYQQQINFLI